MGPFLSSCGNKYILVVVDYVSKSVEALPSLASDTKTVIKFFRKIIFPLLSIPRMVIGDGGSHFIEAQFKNLLKKNGVAHKLPHHITLKPVGKWKVQIGKSRIFLKRWFLS